MSMLFDIANRDIEKSKNYILDRVIFEPNTSCWIWGLSTRSAGKLGYGQMTFSMLHTCSHRFSYAAFKGDPGELCVCHTCDYSLCCNPDHLFLGTLKDNTHDMIRKGRKNSQKGSLHSGAKLIESDIIAIRLLHENGHTQRSIAKKYNVTFQLISKIITKKAWIHI